MIYELPFSSSVKPSGTQFSVPFPWNPSLHSQEAIWSNPTHSEYGTGQSNLKYFQKIWIFTYSVPLIGKLKSFSKYFYLSQTGSHNILPGFFKESMQALSSSHWVLFSQSITPEMYIHT